MRKGKDISYKERVIIETLLGQNMTQTYIASQIKRTRQAVSQEIKRGSVMQICGYKEKCVYYADTAQIIADKKQSRKGAPIKILKDTRLIEYIQNKILHEKYSPQAVIYDIQINHANQYMVLIHSKTTLYNYIDKRIFEKISNIDLPEKVKRRNQKKKILRISKMNDGKSIETRPKEIQERNIYGHWEMDTVQSCKGVLDCLLVLTERMTREELIYKIPDKSAKSTIKVLNKIERQIGTNCFRNKFKTITVDNGCEFSDWRGAEKSVYSNAKRTSIYFCHPYCASERGSNEFANRMIRRWIPKGCDISKISNKRLEKVRDWLNNYPRGIFNGYSAIQTKTLV